VAIPQKKFLGKGISQALSNRMLREVASGAEFAAPAAFDDTLHAENKPVGRAAATPVASPDCANSRRVKRKVGPVSPMNDIGAID